MDFFSAALHLTSFGYKVFPLAIGEKIPAIPSARGGRGCLDATDDEDILSEWAKRYPKANIGIACGLPSNIVVIDLDPRNGSDTSIEFLKSRKQIFLPTATARTANGGTHLYYTYEPELKNSKSVLAAGVDFKTTGGYVVAPPSVLTGGKAYTWLASPLGENLPRMPRWAIEKLKPKPEPLMPKPKDAPKEITPLVQFVAAAGSGERNNKLFWAACRAAENGVGRSAQGSLVAAAVAAGLPKIEAEKTVNSALKRSLKT